MAEAEKSSKNGTIGVLAESALLQVLGRLFLVIGVPLGLILANSQVQSNRSLSDGFYTLADRMTRMETTVAVGLLARQDEVEGDVADLEDRIRAIEANRFSDADAVSLESRINDRLNAVIDRVNALDPTGYSPPGR